MICGIDEAGRGPVIGPLVIAGVSAGEGEIGGLVEVGVRDSKKLNKDKRLELYRYIVGNYLSYSVKVYPPELDGSRARGINLNRLEAIKFAEVIDHLKPGIVFIDSADVVLANFQSDILENMHCRAELVIEHKADETYPIVSAASIVAKVERDKEIEKLKEKYGELGSGYPSDPTTIAFLEQWFRENHSFPDFVRKSWKTSLKAMNRKILDFL